MGHRVTLGNPPITVDLRRSARAKRLSLRVSRLDGAVSLTLPLNASDRDAMAFLAEREGWLRGHVAQVAGAVAVGAATQLPYAGRVVTVTPTDVRRPVLRGDALCVPQDPAKIATRAKAFLLTAARDELVARSDHYARQLGRSYGPISLRDPRSRWGSCSSAGRLMYSWRLIMAPPAVLDYVAAHEVAHLVEMNHAPAFWSVVASLMPGYAAQRGWLRRHGDQLHRYRFD